MLNINFFSRKNRLHPKIWRNTSSLLFIIFEGNYKQDSIETRIVAIPVKSESFHTLCDPRQGERKKKNNAWESRIELIWMGHVPNRCTHVENSRRSDSRLAATLLTRPTVRRWLVLLLFLPPSLLARGHCCERWLDAFGRFLLVGH